LTEGKNSRLHRVLVEDEQLCAWISGGVSSYRHPGFFNLALEVVPGVSHELVESRLFDLVRELRRSGLSEEDLTRAKRTFEADWVFAHERIHHRGLTVAAALAHYDRTFAYRYRDAVLATSAKEVGAAIDSYLDPESGVLGWSLAEGRD
jgi:predicted Zn-dependent peptidase